MFRLNVVVYIGLSKGIEHTRDIQIILWMHMQPMFMYV